MSAIVLESGMTAAYGRSGRCLLTGALTMVGSFADYCGRAASGHAAVAPLISVMNSRSLHSITSSVRASKLFGGSMPTACAAFILITSSNFVAFWIGRSPGFSPFSIRST